ncbi:MAG: 4'-phosphopantetheinyl transferase superfamily protein [Lachnospiraceae bacterium]|nr:4'-phosphopantetheinyl transferase superfamily protein [Candidatus Colinaster scatohippi]
MTKLHLYIFNIEEISDDKKFEQLYDLVSQDRQNRIDRIKFDDDKKRSLGAGILFEKALDDIGVPKNERVIGYGEHGKPQLELHPEVCFNISHSGKYAVLVINTQGNICGCDVEYINNKRKIENIAKRILTASEAEMINEINASDHNEGIRAFYDIWTVKESIVKAIGIGLGIEFSDIDIAARSEEGGSVVKAVVRSSSEVFYIKRIELDSEYSLSICTKDENISISECKYEFG